MGFATGQAEHQIGFDRAHRQMFARCLQLRPIGQSPADFGAGEIGVEKQSGFSLKIGLVPMGFQRIAHIRRAPVLPDDGGGQRFASAPVPEHHRFALVGNADACDGGCAACQCYHLARAFQCQFPDFGGVMFNKPWRWVILRQWALRGAQAGTILCKQHGPCGCCTFVNDKDMVGHMLSLWIGECDNEGGGSRPLSSVTDKANARQRSLVALNTRSGFFSCW